MKKRLALAVIVCLFTLLIQLESPSLPAQAAQLAPVVQVAPAVDVNLLIASDPIVEDDTFIVLITLDPTHIAKVSAFQVYLDWDPAVLKLVPASLTDDVEPGAPFANRRFKDVLQNSFDNSLGHLAFSGGAGVGGLTMVGPFVAGAVKFQAIGSATSTTIAFATVDPRQTKVLAPGLIPMPGTRNGVSFPVGGNAPLSDLFKSGS